MTKITHSPRNREPRVCISKRCPVTFIPTKPRQRYCSHACAKRSGYYRDTERAKVRAIPCFVEGCPETAQHYLAGPEPICRVHYGRKNRTGSYGPPERMRGANKTYRWLGEGRYLLDTGYVVVKPEGGTRTLLGHRVIMERLLGRKLIRGEQVHHKNGVRDDNRPANLELWVKAQPAGQRVEDLVAFVVEHYPEQVKAALEGRPQFIF